MPWLKRCPPCVTVRKTHHWSDRRVILHNANGEISEKTCPYCGATRRRFDSNHRAYPSYTEYRLARIDDDGRGTTWM